VGKFISIAIGLHATIADVGSTILKQKKQSDRAPFAVQLILNRITIIKNRTKTWKMFVFARNVETRKDTNTVQHVNMICAHGVTSLWLSKTHILNKKETKNMKIAITSTGNTLEAKLDSRFGRCTYFVIFDTESQATEFIPNQNKENIEGAGPASVQFVASRGVKKVVSGEFGAKVKTIFDQLQIQLIVINDPEKTVSEIIELLNPKN
jgi:predicted Fe-Mo cluster-binding NifX family protein